MEFGGKIVFIGYGSVARCVLVILKSFLKVSSKQITIIDFEDHRGKAKDLLAEGTQYIVERLSPENYAQVLKSQLKAGDLLIDLAWNIDTVALIEWCQAHHVCYLNTSVEVWDPYSGARNKHPTELTLYYRQMRLREMVARSKVAKASTAIVDHGANPGLVSHFTKQALIEIAETVLKKGLSKKPKELEAKLADKDFAQLAYLLDVKTIHVSERDTQITAKPKRPNEFVNTWSVEGFIEEGLAPAELGWGTHETLLPKGAFFHPYGPGNQICLAQKGIKTWVKSWVPSGPITGMVIRHGEAFSISDALTVKKGDEVLYRPTVHYAYCPSDSAINSLHELEMRHFVQQHNQRILSDEIIEGKDELGCLLMGHELGAWWIGSILDIETARRLAPGQNATTLQVAASVAAAAVYAIRHPELGFCLPDQLNHEEILQMALPYLGEFISTSVKWSPWDFAEDFADYGETRHMPRDWQFASFALSPREFETVFLDN